MSKTELYLDKPMLNAPGSLGFSPDLKGPIDFSIFGAFVTNPVSWEPRYPASGTRYLPFPGGFLVHTGHPNPGLRTVIQQHARRWANSPLPIIIHLLAQDAYVVEKMVRHLEGLDGIVGVAISLPPEIDVDSAYTLTTAALGELAVIIQLPFERARLLAEKLESLGINAFSIAPPRGILQDSDGFLVTGRYYGPSIFPLALNCVKNIIPIGIPIIGGGGIYTKKDLEIMLDTGAIGVFVDTVLWRDPIFKI